MWAATAIAAAGVVIGYIGSQKAGDAAKKQSREEAKYDKMLTKERLRQLEVTERVAYGETIAGYAGSGVISTLQGAGRGSPASGSVKSVLAEQKKEFEFEKKITEDAGASRVAQALAGGKATSDMYRYSGYANVAAGVSSIITNYRLGKA